LPHLIYEKVDIVFIEIYRGGGTYKKSQVCNTQIVKVDKNKY
jgi:hypothetical protein